MLRVAVMCVAVTGCFDPQPLEGAPCEASAQCPTPQRCVAGACTTQEPVQDADVTPIDTAIDAPIDATPDAPHLPCSMMGFACSDGEMFTCGAACWVRCRTPESRNDASAICAGWGGMLGQIDDAAEQSCVENEVYDNHWIGLTQSAGATEPEIGWRWNDGAAVGYTRWQPGIPDDQDDDENGTEQCGKMQADGTWDDVRCSSSYRFLCER